MAKYLHGYKYLYNRNYHFVTLLLCNGKQFSSLNVSYIEVQIKRILLSVLLITSSLSPSNLNAQNDLILNNTIQGNVVVSAPGSISLKPGFHATSGSSFHAFIGPYQGPGNTAAISHPSDNNNTVSGTTGTNYIKETIYRAPYTDIQTGSFRHQDRIQYFDGLGRPLQEVSVGASAAGADIIQSYFYDDFGREAIRALPITDSRSGEFRAGITLSTVNSYYSSGPPVGKDPDNYAYSRTIYDNSPLNRIVSLTGPGADWVANNRNVQMNYFSNTEAKQGWRVTGDYSFSSFNYPTGSLFVNESIDEEGHVLREYKDKLGRLVIKETALGSNWLRTAYIYDDHGNLSCVVPPMAANPGTDVDLCYYYKYDNFKRLVEKKIPGGGIIKMAYDSRDRLRASQNSLQASTDEWSFIKYDCFNRPVITGTVIFTGDISYEIANDQINESISGSSSNFGYTDLSFPHSSETVLTVTYYDNYDFIEDVNLNDSLDYSFYNTGVYDISSIIDLTPVGMATGTMTRIISDETDNLSVPLTVIFSVSYYDKYGHVLRMVSENQFKGKDIVSNLYEDMTWLLLQTKEQHFRGEESINIEKWFDYDHAGRLLATRQKINQQDPVTLNAIRYNECGEVVSRYLHSSQTDSIMTFAQKVDYNYNIRGWLNKINDPSLINDNDLFGMQLYYNDTEGMGGLSSESGLYNGNISGIKWKSKNDYMRGYQFSYDSLNRILQSNYSEGDNLNLNDDYFSEKIKGYDKNGNILGLLRKTSNTIVDSLNYKYYSGTNRIYRITDSGSDSALIDDYPGNSQIYEYDVNGNMSYDGAKDFYVDYVPYLNLPQKIDFGNNGRIFYQYTSTGIKVLKHTEPGSGTGTRTDYTGSIVYEGGKLSYINTEEGRLVAVDTGGPRRVRYEYSLKDHLGNSRVVFLGPDTGDTVSMVQTTSYYPFGLVMHQTNLNPFQGYKKNKYLYNGKELQDDKLTSEAVNWLDYGARFYDPQIGRWNVPDPHGESYYNWSIYSYCYNNPIKYIDHNGMDGEISGKGKEDDPYIVKADYYYYGLKEDEKKAFISAINSYNNAGSTYKIKTKEETIFVVFKLNSVEVADEAQANKLMQGNEFSNIVSEGVTQEGRVGESNGRSAILNRKNCEQDISKTPGGDLNKLMEGTFIHEIGHTLAGNHNDPGNIMIYPSATPEKADYGYTDKYIYSYPSVSNAGIRALVGRGGEPIGTTNSKYLREKENKKIKEGTVGILHNRQ